MNLQNQPRQISSQTNFFSDFLTVFQKVLTKNVRGTSNLQILHSKQQFVNILDKDESSLIKPSKNAQGVT